MIYAQPGSTFEAILEGVATGLVGTVGVRVIDPPVGDVITARTTSGITEQPAGSGVYATELVAPTVRGVYLVVWDIVVGGTPLTPDDTFTEQLEVTMSIPSGPGDLTGPTYYASVQDVRDELGDDGDSLDDAEVVRLIIDAEDLVDEYLGARCVDPTTGRKVVRADVEEWQWTKLNRATTKLAALLHTDPDLTGVLYSEVSGPEFSVKGREGSRFGSSIDALLNQSGLRGLPNGLGSISMAGGRSSRGGELLAN